MPIEYTIQQTRRGDYAVRFGRNLCHDHRSGQEVRFATTEEADGWIAARRAEEAAVEREGATRRAYHAEMAQRAPDLVARQLRWQEERNRLYEELRGAEKEAAQLARNGLSAYGLANPRYGEYQRSKQDRSAEYAAELGQRYAQACRIDTHIKAAYAASDLATWATALSAGEALLGYQYQHSDGGNDASR